MSARTAARARRTTAAALVLTLATATLAACGDDTAGDAPAAERTAANGDVHNDADVEFATEMIPHHADALVMVDMTQGRDLSPELAALTEDIRAAQAPEIESMVDWLTAWGEDVPETSRDHVNSHGGSHGEDEGEEMDGMGMDPDDLTELEDAEGGAFESMWLEMMIEHHEGAIEMAEAEQEDGLFADAVALAESIESSQAAEIELMEELLGQ
ncbi:DUF305 domain-containing protein [Nocardioides eburneiflavus]|uniref:DUF305 domain-containing protein n=1 Tax=Nocardioides eburneiflavus TaxID=2518372 RepID=A0A4Z1C644_9ACTN|nr:DUF305 domain-containing protein [Nocardioides eburneiflavus]TGN64742.1 DUF305 domain-containing protein [Nocardioides eburneiflavus]